jgi:hypothetical protein
MLCCFCAKVSAAKAVGGLPHDALYNATNEQRLSALAEVYLSTFCYSDAGRCEENTAVIALLNA